jgi:hypothetical protein
MTKSATYSGNNCDLISTKLQKMCILPNEIRDNL